MASEDGSRSSGKVATPKNGMTFEEMTEIALADGRKMGLPRDWKVKFSGKSNRRKWISPGPNSRTYDSLVKALGSIGIVKPDDTKSQHSSNTPSRGQRKSSRKRKRTKKAAPEEEEEDEDERGEEDDEDADTEVEEEDEEEEDDNSQSSAPPPKRQKTKSGRRSPVPSKMEEVSEEEVSEEEAEPLHHSAAGFKSSEGAFVTINKHEDVDQEEDDEDDDEDEEEVPTSDPEVDPEIALEVEDPYVLSASSTPSVLKSILSHPPKPNKTVHWDPHSPEGKLIGCRIRVYVEKLDKWQLGRIVNFDPMSRRHKIEYYTKPGQDVTSPRKMRKPFEETAVGTEWAYLYDPELMTVHIGTRIVWAQVKGFAWWPAQVMEPMGKNLPPEIKRPREGYVYVEFFGSDQIAVVRDIGDYIRPFNHGLTDSVIKKNKKKRNPEAVRCAMAEDAAMTEIQDEAAVHFATKAFLLFNHCSGNILGRRVTFLWTDVNYPYGEQVRGFVRQYSPAAKKWLIDFVLQFAEEEATSSGYRGNAATLYSPSWINITAKECNLKLLSTAKREVGRRKSIEDTHAPPPTLDELVPYIPGFIAASEEYRSKCVLCLRDAEKSLISPTVEDKDIVLRCDRCHHLHHHGCLDPSHVMPVKAARLISIAQINHEAATAACSTDEEISTLAKDQESSWLCEKCTKCMGCRKYDLAFGCRPYPKAVVIVRPRPQSSCARGEPCNEVNDHYQPDLCSDCVTRFDEGQYCPNCGLTFDDYECTRKQQAKLWRRRNCVKDDDEATDDSEDDEHDDEHEEWGYSAFTMLTCDKCNKWVHAACANLSKTDYEAIGNNTHPIYNKEFLCANCCRLRCEAVLDLIQKQDQMTLFAAPVTEDMAPDYKDVIKNPMDLHTLRQMLERHELSYNDYCWIKEYFELMVYNAMVYNPPNTKYWKEAQRFHAACLDTVFNKALTPASLGPTPYSEKLEKCIRKAEEEIKLEKERQKSDKTATKKDLVAGADVAAVELSPLIKPQDPPSCVPHVVTKMSQLDAHTSCWLDCCFTCGSSGALDTMLFCVDCGEAYHSFCAGAPIHSMDDVATSVWRCANCKCCELSGLVPADETKLLFCEMCDRAFQLDLLDPPLSKVPDGLFICGQCVQCSQCEGETRNSRKFWSRNPCLCYRCGGCSGVVDKKAENRKCVVCDRLSREDDDDVIQCSAYRCKKFVHLGCDPVAVEAKMKVDALTDEQKEQGKKVNYKCPGCRSKSDAKKKAELSEREVKKALRQAKVEDAEDQRPSQVELHDRLLSEMTWQVREMWRDEYQSIVDDAEKMYRMSLGNKHYARIVSNGFIEKINASNWVRARAARFIGLMARQTKDFKRRKLLSRPIHISALVAKAKLAASFLALGCRYYGVEFTTLVTSWQRANLLLMEPDEFGHVLYPPDIVRVDESMMLDEAFWQASQAIDDTLTPESSSPLHPDAEDDEAAESHAEDEDDTPSRLSGQKHLIARDMEGTGLIKAGPMHGSDFLGAAEEQPWGDSRRCCLCHTCGDDDAGPHPSDDLDGEATSSEGILGHAGRLLPMPSSSAGSWVHASCAIWSSEVWEAAGGVLHQVDKARHRGNKMKCFGCGRSGPTVGCSKQHCVINYHFPCAVYCGAVFTHKKQMYCKSHVSYAANVVPLKEASQEHMRILRVHEPESTSPIESGDDEERKPCIRVGSLIVHSLGEIEQDLDGYYTKCHITPRGYVATRIFWSFNHPMKRTMYILRVEKATTGRPVFSIVDVEYPDSVIRSNSSQESYSILIMLVLETNENQFASIDDVNSLKPIKRVKNETYGLNGPQVSNLFHEFGIRPTVSLF